MCTYSLPSIKEYWRHVGRHLEETFLFALPRVAEYEDVAETSEEEVVFPRTEDESASNRSSSVASLSNVVHRSSAQENEQRLSKHQEESPGHGTEAFASRKDNTSPSMLSEVKEVSKFTLDSDDYGEAPHYEEEIYKEGTNDGAIESIARDIEAKLRFQAEADARFKIAAEKAATKLALESRIGAKDLETAAFTTEVEFAVKMLRAQVGETHDGIPIPGGSNAWISIKDLSEEIIRLVDKHHKIEDRKEAN